MEGVAEGYGSRSGSTSQTGPISLSPTGSGHVWTDTQAGCPCYDPSSRTGLSVPWQQQLVKNVSVSGWEKNGQPGRLKGHGGGQRCQATADSALRPLSPGVTPRHSHKASPQHKHLGMPLSVPAPTGTHLTHQSAQPAHTTPYPQVFCIVCPVLLVRRGEAWGPRGKLNIAPVSPPSIPIPIPRAAGLSAHLDSRLTGLGRRLVF